jgi:hypothetical protein
MQIQTNIPKVTLSPEQTKSNLMGIGPRNKVCHNLPILGLQQTLHIMMVMGWCIFLQENDDVFQHF